jgi:hypothetical protein
MIKQALKNWRARDAKEKKEAANADPLEDADDVPGNAEAEASGGEESD